MDALLVPLRAHVAHSGYPLSTTQAQKTNRRFFVPIHPAHQAAPRLARKYQVHH